MKRKLILLPVLALGAIGALGAGTATAATPTTATKAATVQSNPWPGGNQWTQLNNEECTGVLNLVLLANC
ncbi:hypothetical protein [Actinomadura flavalba]|uniref:hypothetical protein n=1 Tax=Actinomadura flavalba TaxID=1120938 RepID=UPI00036E04DE|nr:hypothetical protein [Actinomadura flavalba]